MDSLKGGQFGPTLKKWFASNTWPQSITEDWAKASGSLNGPWASQISKAMNGKSEPKAEFFLALANFNQAVTERKVQGFTDRRLVDRIIAGQPLCHGDGQPFDAPDFFSLYVGLLEPPELAEPEPTLTQEDVDLWHKDIREMFRKVAVKYMEDKPGAWVLVRNKMIEMAGPNAGTAHSNNDDLSWCQEILSGFRDATLEEAVRMAARWRETQPLLKAMEALLGEPGKRQMTEAVSKAQTSQVPPPFGEQGMGFRGKDELNAANYAPAIAQA